MEKRARLARGIGIVGTLLLTLKATALASGPASAVLNKPIGHSLQTPEARKRIATLLAQAAKGRANSAEGTSASPGQAGPLVGGEYGFSAPTPLQGAPKALVSLGSVSPAYGLVVEKLHHRLTVFKLNENREYEIVRTYRAITGKDPGDKVSRGDLKTPEGIYFITGRISDAGLPPKYGRLALTLDYPNIYDRRKRKSGAGIWIHATDDPSRLKRPFDTEGCVVVSNEDVIDLEQFAIPFETPVIITKEMTTVDPKELEEPRQGAIEMIDAWRKSWENSDFPSYMEFYSKKFISLGMTKQRWEKYKQTLSNAREGKIEVRISEPKIVAFENQLLAVFMQEYVSADHSDFGRKFLYLQWEGDRYRIIAEKWYKTRKTETAFRDFRPM